MHSEGDKRISASSDEDVDFESLMLIRFFNDIMLKLEVPKPRISQMYTYWCPP
jgi:hypothetical protein